MIFILPFPAPPLRSNKRLHHMAEHRIKRDIRQAGFVQAKKWMIDNPGTYPLLTLVEIRMTWFVPTRHRRDSDAGQPTLKSWVDGVVDSGLLYDDSWVWVRRMWCEVEYAPRRPMALQVEIVCP